jgi:methionyl aminopeptidase
MINIRSEREIELLKEAGKIVAGAHSYIKDFIKPGITTLELDEKINNFFLSKGAVSSIYGFDGFPQYTCISINEEVVHGIPSKRKLKEGDIVSIDLSAKYKGYHSDSAWTYPVGSISKDKEYLILNTEKALYEGIKAVKPGVHVGSISNAIEKYAKSKKLGIVKELVGHGVGSELHEEPDVPNYGNISDGPLLKEGMVIAIEPMLNFGTAKVYILEDDWTIITRDNKPSAHFEHTVLVTKEGHTILTER